MSQQHPTYYDVIVIGAGAAGLMAATESAKRGRTTLLIEHTDKIGEKIRISGGGRCNFTNIHVAPHCYLSNNPHFCKSALANYTPQDFIKLIESYEISYHEKTLGQLFCDGSAKQIIAMFLDLCQKYGVLVKTQCQVSSVAKNEHFEIQSNQGLFLSQSLVIATGGLSIPQIGATDFGHKIATQFGLNIVPLRPALVPLTVPAEILATFSELSGVSQFSKVSYQKAHFTEAFLFTHRGLSGPAILQISSYLPTFNDQTIEVDLLPQRDVYADFLKDKNSKQTVLNYLKNHLSNRFAESFAQDNDVKKPITDLSLDKLKRIAEKIHHFKIPIAGSEGYRKAEVTIGGVDTNELSSKTMGCKKVPGLFFIGEVVDVTGWLGGYNFQWAWASGFAAGQYC